MIYFVFLLAICCGASEVIVIRVYLALIKSEKGWEPYLCLLLSCVIFLNIYYNLVYKAGVLTIWPRS